LDTIIPPIVSFVVFVVVSLATYKRSPSRHDVIYLIPSEEDVVSGEDVYKWVNPIDVRNIPSRRQMVREYGRINIAQQPNEESTNYDKLKVQKILIAIDKSGYKDKIIGYYITLETAIAERIT